MEEIDKDQNKTVAINADNNEWCDQLVQAKVEFSEELEEIANEFTLRHQKLKQVTTKEDCLVDVQHSEKKLLEEEIRYLVQS